jgi:peroxiredoxin
MNKLSKLGVYWLILIGLSIILPVTSGCEKEKQNIQATTVEQTKAVVTEEKNAAEAKPAEVQQKETTMETKTTTEQKATAPQEQQAAKEPTQQLVPSMTVQQLLDEVRSWETVADDWKGMAIPDFNLPDINGKVHKLSDYRGKNVLISEFAIWSPPCKTQIPFLVELRNTDGEDKLAILGVALKTEKEDLQKVKDFVQKQKINFPVFYEPQNALPTALTVNLFVPCHYFISPDDKLKVGIEEVITPQYLIKVLEAK